MNASNSFLHSSQTTELGIGIVSIVNMCHVKITVITHHALNHLLNLSVKTLDTVISVGF
jgi:hypothetical protein